ncbi:ACP S-malonyltransferase [Bacillus spizizenii]|jgi:polyketide biosynthesis malonyl-CoA-[acyl-carrier-protein] transacylase|uniref:Malonyl CoA-acyl carrier protein transacylase n=1 Tax=Bacillus spizizenii (strain DSM 15029 / JCM 12233 / NBRC 101239 / NRRL B-23049 / TU-B-10) TaxID=1052585 RepID=G4NVD8_BACS4|nr:ACP S-malonyltransferase [Bacillus spizizenii]AEP86699.1 malonyl CoA-acyl carrier protein transacylase [Bacillus spizizenii TU-B-10]KXJ36441.1 poly(3-hydroxyalkanoate) synthetase [Bacillus spizizenii]MEC1436279.1 ACP S-malonyltransferase [Bacillus spizizenii]OPG92156.1 malonyl CoA-acyl carrier protein transacylase [Bacillus spizizenii]GEK24338.1 polyketide biosynthesis malonyl CoA-acyl carrier protein transacylase PksC [Bacillus spizizenii]
MITYVFPGQGSQKQGMGSDLFDEFKELTAQADEILGYSIKRLCMENPYSNLNKTQFTQPALYVVNALSYLKKIREAEAKPDFVAGHSLGEYNALFAAGAFDFETGLKLVRKRGELMSMVSNGGMAAIMGLNEEQVAKALKEYHLHDVDIANVNAPYQIVISGKKDEIEKAASLFETMTEVTMVLPLNVSGAFHSRYMNKAKEEFEQFLQTFHFSPLSIPVISNVYAKPYTYELMKQTLADQINHSVKWTESISYLMKKGQMEFEEIGPGNVLTGLIHRIKKDAEPMPR